MAKQLVGEFLNFLAEFPEIGNEVSHISYVDWKVESTVLLSKCSI